MTGVDLVAATVVFDSEVLRFGLAAAAVGGVRHAAPVIGIVVGLVAMLGLAIAYAWPAEWLARQIVPRLVHSWYWRRIEARWPDPIDRLVMVTNVVHQTRHELLAWCLDEIPGSRWHLAGSRPVALLGALLERLYWPHIAWRAQAIWRRRLLVELERERRDEATP